LPFEAPDDIDEHNADWVARLFQRRRLVWNHLLPLSTVKSSHTVFEDDSVVEEFGVKGIASLGPIDDNAGVAPGLAAMSWPAYPEKRGRRERAERITGVGLPADG
jgi:hypothetical protein